MTLDEAIKHEEEVAKIQENNAKSYPRPDKNVKGSGKRYNAYLKCAEEHRQLAEWLKDYKRLLEQEPIVDKIRAEIESIAFDLQEIDGEHESIIILELNDVLSIIDKYKAESEDKKYEAKIITRGKCMMCGKELTEGLFFCKECRDKANSRK